MSFLDILEPLVSSVLVPLVSAMFGAGGAFWLARRKQRK